MEKEEIQEEFIHKLDEYTREAACGRHFILVDRLQSWLRSPIGGEGTSTYASRLHNRVAYSDWKKPGFPIKTDKFKPGDDCCLLVFSILQKLERGDLLDVFSKKKKVDKLLPIPRQDLDEITIDGDHPDLSSDFFDKFFELQHRFRPASFDLHDRNDWGKDKVVPICRKKPIKEGGTAKLWQIDVPEEFVGHDLRDKCSGSRFNAGLEQDPDWRYEFALKTFAGNKYEFYKNEMDAFTALQGHEGMVRWLAEYEKVDQNGSKTYNILLEFGEMDLGDHFKRTLPPVLPLEIAAFWRSLFAVANAVEGVHDLKVRDDSGQTKEYHGQAIPWHTDIKPDNILFVEHRLKKEKDDITEGENQSKLVQKESTFKLADPGFAKFVKKSQEESTEVPKQKLLGGTETYGAPEYPGRSEHPVSQAIDIWSLGCVFSSAATWIVLDHTGVELFNKARQRAIKNYIEAQRRQSTSYDQNTTVSQGDQFHNGHEVLNAVTEWHKYLRTVSRKTDTITCRVLDLVDNKMLLGTPEHRIKANELCSELALIFKWSSQQERAQLPETLMTILGEIDEEESIHAAESNRRSRYLAEEGLSSSKTRPLKTTHRQSIWLDQNLRTQDGKYPKHQGPKLQTVAEQQHFPEDTYPTPQLPTTHDRFHSKVSAQRPPTRSRRSGTAKKHPPQNYFQAVEVVNKREHQRKMDKFRVFSKKDDLRDGLLLSYFRGKRDIIFLVDNAESMEAHWYEATQLLDVLVKKARDVDEDGMDLRFTTGNISLHRQNSAHEFVKSMQKARPITHSKERVHTDLRISLGEIWQEYLSKLRRRTLNVKDVVVIVLTDGIWKGMEDPKDVADYIKQFAIEMKALQNLKHRPFSVEFVQFGNDEAATRLLRYLDDCLHELGIPDMIDTEHSTGDVNKMLLGSFVEEYDKDEGDELGLVGSSDCNRYGSEQTMSPESSRGEGGLGTEHSPQSVQRSPTGPTYARPYSRANG